MMRSKGTKWNVARWNVVVNEQTDRELRRVLAERGGNKKGALSEFIEQAVLERLQALGECVSSDSVERAEAVSGGGGRLSSAESLTTSPLNTEPLNLPYCYEELLGLGRVD